MSEVLSNHVRGRSGIRALLLLLLWWALLALPCTASASRRQQPVRTSELQTARTLRKREGARSSVGAASSALLEDDASTSRVSRHGFSATSDSDRAGAVLAAGGSTPSNAVASVAVAGHGSLGASRSAAVAPALFHRAPENISGRELDAAHAEEDARDFGFFDEFALVYWGGVLLLFGLCWCSTRIVSSATNGTSMGPPSSTTASAFVEMGSGRELSKNMWSFFVVVSLDKAQTISGSQVSTVAVGMGNLLLGFLQMFTIFLLVHDIDPNADPVTEEPSSPWKRTTWSVNCMKWIQVTFMATALASEVSQAMQLFTSTVMMHPDQFRVPRIFLILTAVGQYVVTLWVLFGGVSVVLSFQAVPDILYSSMAIVFVSSIDDLMYQFVETVFEIEADFHIFKDDERGTPRFCSDAEDSWHVWLPVIGRVVSLFPLVFAIFLMGESWYHNIMPNAWIRRLTHDSYVPSTW